MVGKFIGQYLTENGIKQTFVAEKVGIPKSQMSDICTKDRSVDSVLYYKICKALNVPLETFLEKIEEE
jgi:transcriptional regulator with XRE-family HTH domain